MNKHLITTLIAHTKGITKVFEEWKESLIDEEEHNRKIKAELMKFTNNEIKIK